MPRRKQPTEVIAFDDPRYVRALSHPLRVRLLAMLAERDASPVQLAQNFEASLGTVAYHVRTLEQLGLIEMVATRQRRGATEHVYRLRVLPGVTDHAWANASNVAKQALINKALTEIGDLATRSAAAGGFDREDAHSSRTRLKLDQEGWAELAEITKEWLNRVHEIKAESEARLAESDEPATDAAVVIMLFEAASYFNAPAPASAKPASRPAPQREAVHS